MAIAARIETETSNVIGNRQAIIRGIQSGKHSIKIRDKLIDYIVENGNEKNKSSSNNKAIYAAQFEPGLILKILEGFHVYKPKSEEKPQYPVDVWMVFDIDAYDNIEYVHPRHKVVARDKWKRKDSHNNGLMVILTVN